MCACAKREAEGSSRMDRRTRLSATVRSVLRVLPLHWHKVVLNTKSVISDLFSIVLLVVGGGAAIAFPVILCVIVALISSNGLVLFAGLAAVLVAWVVRAAFEEERGLKIVEQPSGHLSTSAQIEDAIKELKKTRTLEQAAYMG